MALALDLKDKPFYYGLGVGVFIAVAIFIGAHLLQFKKMKETIKQKEDKYHKLEAQVQEGRTANRQVVKFREEVRKLEEQLDKLVRILPSQKETHVIIKKIKALADQGDFDFTALIPANLINKDFYAEWPINVNVRGNYHNLALFFDRLRTFPRIINIQSMRINALSKQVKNTIDANFTMVTYIYLEKTGGPS